AASTCRRAAARASSCRPAVRTRSVAAVLAFSSSAAACSTLLGADFDELHPLDVGGAAADARAAPSEDARAAPDAVAAPAADGPRGSGAGAAAGAPTPAARAADARGGDAPPPRDAPQDSPVTCSVLTGPGANALVSTASGWHGAGIAFLAEQDV